MIVVVAMDGVTNEISRATLVNAVRIASPRKIGELIAANTPSTGATRDAPARRRDHRIFLALRHAAVIFAAHYRYSEAHWRVLCRMAGRGNNCFANQITQWPQ